MIFFVYYPSKLSTRAFGFSLQDFLGEDSLRAVLLIEWENGTAFVSWTSTKRSRLDDPYKDAAKTDQYFTQDTQLIERFRRRVVICCDQAQATAKETNRL